MKAKYSINDFSSKLTVQNIILGHGNVYFVIATNSGKEFDGRWAMEQISIFGLTIGVPM